MQITRTKKEQPRPRGSLLPVFKSRRFAIKTFVLYLYSLFFYSQCMAHFGGLCCKISGKYNSPFYFCFRSLFFLSLILAISISCSKICKWEYLSSEIGRVLFPLEFSRKVLLFSFPVPVVGPSSRSLACFCRRKHKKSTTRSRLACEKNWAHLIAKSTCVLSTLSTSLLKYRKIPKISPSMYKLLQI